MGRAKAKEMIREHLLWHYHYPSEFSSWSSLLLFVLQHAVREDAEKDKYNEHNVCICVLDTRALSEVYIYPATTLLRVYGIDDCGKLKHSYYEGEYLAHGGVEDGTCFKVVSLRDLRHSKLCELVPEPETQAEFLFKRVWELRDMEKVEREFNDIRRFPNLERFPSGDLVDRQIPQAFG